MLDRPRVKIIGAGVIGLSVGCALKEDGCDVTVVASKMPSLTTSAVAAAFWEPFHADGKDVGAWAEQSYQHFISLSAANVGGVSLQVLRRLFVSSREREIWERDNPWHEALSDELNYRPMSYGCIPAGFSEGVLYDVPVIHMPSYLDYLTQRMGLPIVQREVLALSEEMDGVDVLINCTGFGSQAIRDVRDGSLRRFRGQILVGNVCPELRQLMFITTGEKYEQWPLYVVPRGDFDVVLGGTYWEQDDDDVTPDDAVSRQILDRCISVEPLLNEMSIKDFHPKVGLRPCRTAGVRCELDKTTFAKPVIHNYGHGGAGVTLSWGCALHVRALLRRLIAPSVLTP